MSMILCIIMTIYLRRENARRDREHKAPSDYSLEEKVAEREKGDNATFFRYTVWESRSSQLGMEHTGGVVAVTRNVVPFKVKDRCIITR